MKISKTQGYRVHQPLSTSFTVNELGGSDAQKYNSLTGEYNPDRRVTPLVFMPSLHLTDPDGQMPSGDYTTKLVSVKWTVMRYVDHKLQAPAEMTVDEEKKVYDYGLYTIGMEDHELTYKANTATNEVVMISFSAQLVDSRRTPPQVLDFHWEKTMTCITENPANIRVELTRGTKVNLSPLKNLGQFTVGAKVINGPGYIDPKFVTFRWQQYGSDGWADVCDDDPWYVSGNTQQYITLDQDFIGKVRLRCMVQVKDMHGTYYSPVSLLRRWYGQYDEDLAIIVGKYIYDDTTQSEAEVTVTNRQGVIRDPCRYFDISIYYPDADGTMHCISNTTTAIVEKVDINNADHVFGYAVRELSEFIPLATEDGDIITDEDGNPIFAQFPEVEVETD